MKTPQPRSSSTTTAAAGDREAALRAGLLALQVRQRDLTNEMIDLEKAGEIAVDPEAADIDIQAYAALMGEAVPTDRTPLAPVRDLKAVRRELQVVNRGLEIGPQLLQRERQDRQLNALIARMDEWRAIVRQRAIALLELQKINRAARDFKRSIGGMPSLPCDLGPRGLLGFGDVVGDESYRFIQAVLAQGIMTKGEVDRYAHD